MHDASTGTGHAIPAVSPVDFLTEAKRALGVRTTAEVAAACGISKRTVERLVANPRNALVRNAVAFSDATGISLVSLTGSSIEQPELSEAA